MAKRSETTKTCRFYGAFDQEKVEFLLDQAKRSGAVTAYHVDPGVVVWFTGPRGDELKDLRKAVLRLMEKT